MTTSSACCPHSSSPTTCWKMHFRFSRRPFGHSDKDSPPSPTRRGARAGKGLCGRAKARWSTPARVKLTTSGTRFAWSQMSVPAGPQEKNRCFKQGPMGNVGAHDHAGSKHVAEREFDKLTPLWSPEPCLMNSGLELKSSGAVGSISQASYGCRCSDSKRHR